MAEKALTNIQGGEVKGEKTVSTATAPDVNETTVREGENVKKSDFTDEQWEQLKAAGAVTDDPKDLVRPNTYKAADVQERAHQRSIASRGNEAPEPQDDTNPANAADAAETNKQANEQARKAKEAEREFNEKLDTDPDFRASVLEGFEGQPRQHQAVIHAARQDFIANRVTGDEPRAVPGRKAAATKQEDKK